MDLHGSCSCGRNNYVVEIPSNSRHLAQVYFDNSSTNRRHLASPFTAWLRVPLDWFYSATFAFFPDESHPTIRRTFTSPFDTQSRRQFCGYCGTQLTLWKEDDDFIDITLGSLFDEDLESMEDLGLLQFAQDRAESEAAQQETSVIEAHTPRAAAHRGAPWFESMVEDSRLGKLQRQKGGHTSKDGSVRYEWEVVEWTSADGDEAAASTSKRKLGDLEEQQDDIQMRT